MAAEDPRIPVIRRALEEAHFDERTPEEKGFAEVFEKELKPKLIENLAASLEEAEARKRRRGYEIILMVVSLPVAILALLGPVFLFFIWPDPSAIGAKFPTIMRLMAFIALFIMVWVFLVLHFFFKWRTKVPDRVQRLVMERILERFGCRIGGAALRHHAVAASSPIRPRWHRADLRPETVEGRFQGRLPFVATRIRVWRKDGKDVSNSFDGWHVYVDLPFSFNGTTVIRHRKMGYECDEPKLRELSLEDPEFRKDLVALTDDQVEARVILSPDVIHHVASAAPGLDRGVGGVLLGFSGSRAHIWLPWNDTALSDWQPLHPPKLVQDIHEAFAEMAEIQAFLRDIDVIAESEGFRAQAARNRR